MTVRPKERSFRSPGARPQRVEQEGASENRAKNGPRLIFRKNCQAQENQKRGYPPPPRSVDMLILNNLIRLSVYIPRLPYDVYENKLTYRKHQSS